MTAVLATLRRITRRVWFRAALYTIGGIVFVLLAGPIGSLIPYRIVVNLGQDSVGTILQILASSMLTVTTFSLTAMVTAYSAATTNATPRATQLMIEDQTSQNALSTFLGAFTFSLVGIIALSTGLYNKQGRTILFLGTLLMILIIVVTFLRWIGHLQGFGRMADVIDRVEKAASAALAEYAEKPHLGGLPLGEVPSGAVAVRADSPGWVTTVDVGRLQRIAAEADLRVFVLATPGRTADDAHPLAAVVGLAGGEVLRKVHGSFRIDHHRDYEQDPRLGIIALSEIASRALSPAVNDPGTAIEIVGALQRVLTTLLTTAPDAVTTCDRVYVRGVQLSELLEDAFRPISRDGSGMVEVAIRVQKCLGALAATAPQHAALFERTADAAADRAVADIDRSDRKRLKAVRRAVWS